MMVYVICPCGEKLEIDPMGRAACSGVYMVTLGGR